MMRAPGRSPRGSCCSGRIHCGVVEFSFELFEALRDWAVFAMSLECQRCLPVDAGLRGCEHVDDLFDSEAGY